MAPSQKSLFLLQTTFIKYAKHSCRLCFFLLSIKSAGRAENFTSVYTRMSTHVLACMVGRLLTLCARIVAVVV